RHRSCSGLIIFFGSVVQKIHTVGEFASSSGFSSTFWAASVRRCASSRTSTLYFPLSGRIREDCASARISSTPFVSEALISVALLSSSVARMRARVVLPTPGGPENIHAIGTVPDASFFWIADTTACCPITSENLVGRRSILRVLSGAPAAWNKFG